MAGAEAEKGSSFQLSYGKGWRIQESPENEAIFSVLLGFETPTVVLIVVLQSRRMLSIMPADKCVYGR